MTDNEKAAVAAGLWEPRKEMCRRPVNRPCISHGGVVGEHLRTGRSQPAPDMHDPANLWRALEKLKPDIIRGDKEWLCEISDSHFTKIERCHDTLAGAIFTALVALYEAEHPEKP
jgi:hypothetical protein